MSRAAHAGPDARRGHSGRRLGPILPENLDQRHEENGAHRPVKPIEKSAMSGKGTAAILYEGPSFQRAFGKVTGLARDTNQYGNPYQMKASRGTE